MRLVISGMNTFDTDKKLIELSKIGWEAVTGSICFVRTHVRNDITFLVEGPAKSATGAFNIIQGLKA